MCSDKKPGRSKKPVEGRRFESEVPHRALRDAWNNATHEPVPDKLKDVIARLRKAEEDRRAESGEEE